MMIPLGLTSAQGSRQDESHNFFIGGGLPKQVIVPSPNPALEDTKSQDRKPYPLVI